MPCERAVLFRVRPSVLLLPPGSRLRVLLQPHGARQRRPRCARCASGNGMLGPSARDATASSAILRSRSTCSQTTDQRRVACRNPPPSVRHWRSRCAAPFQCASRHALAYTAAFVTPIAPAARGSNQLPVALFAATCARALPARALLSFLLVSVRQPCLMPSALVLLLRRLLQELRP